MKTSKQNCPTLLWAELKRRQNTLEVQEVSNSNLYFESELAFPFSLQKRKYPAIGEARSGVLRKQIPTQQEKRKKKKKSNKTFVIYMIVR